MVLFNFPPLFFLVTDYGRWSWRRAVSVEVGLCRSLLQDRKQDFSFLTKDLVSERFVSWHWVCNSQLQKNRCYRRRLTSIIRQSRATGCFFCTKDNLNKAATCFVHLFVGDLFFTKPIFIACTGSCYDAKTASLRGSWAFT